MLTEVFELGLDNGEMLLVIHLISVVCTTIRMLSDVGCPKQFSFVRAAAMSRMRLQHITFHFSNVWKHNFGRSHPSINVIAEKVVCTNNFSVAHECVFNIQLDTYAI